MAASRGGWPVSNLAKDFPWDEWAFYQSNNLYPTVDHPYQRMYTWLQRMVYEGHTVLVHDELASISTRAQSSQQGEEAAQSLLNACASGFGSALHIAASRSDSYRHSSCFQMLLENGADVNKACKDVGTPLHLAVISKYLHNSYTVRLLLAHGADPNIKDRCGNSPLNYAVLNRRFGLVGTLVEHGADPNAKDHHGDSPLHYAILDREFDLAEILIRHGGDMKGRIGPHGNAAQTAERTGDSTFKTRLTKLCASVGEHGSRSAGGIVRGSSIRRQ